MTNKFFNKRVNNGINNIVRVTLNDELESIKNNIISLIIEEYNYKLIDKVSDINSKTNPSLYKYEFIDRLNKFKFIEYIGDYKINIKVPTIDSFDFSGKLKILETIMNGVIGTYVEISTDDYIKLFHILPTNEELFDENIEDKIYLVEYNKNVMDFENNKGKKFVKYPFSNTPPIDIFKSSEEYLDKNKNIIIDRIKSNIKNVYKGVIF